MRVGVKSKISWLSVGMVFLLTISPGVSMIDINFGDVAEVLKFSREIVTDLLESYHLIKPKGPGPNEGTDFPFVKMMEKRLMNQIGQVYKKIDYYDSRMEHRTEAVIDAVLNLLPERQILEQSMHDLWKYLGQVENSYQNFIYFSRTPDTYSRFTVEDFSRNMVSSGLNALPNVMKMIHRLVVPPIDDDSDVFRRSILTHLAKNMQEASSQICNTQQSPQQLLYNLYSTIALTEIKGFMMMQFSWTFLKLYNLGNFTEEMELLKQQYAVRTSETLRAVKTAMAFAPRDIWKCDPPKHVPEVTYTELKQLFQGYIVNEVDLNPQGTCKETCGYYSLTKVHGCYKNQFCSTQKRCNGKVVNCQYVDSDMWVCPSDKSSSRRYEYIEYENGMTYGRKENCKRGTTKVDSWWRWLFWHCSYCMCFCDDHTSASDRYFNLRDVTSDIYSNKVVVGVKMLKVNQIIHIQIKEGVLGERGKIDSNTVAWKKIDNYTIFDSNVKSGVDYHTIMWEKRAIDLDDLNAPADHLLTGIRFRLIGAHLNLEIRMTPFNFTTGKLLPQKSLWHSHDTTENSEIYDLNGETLHVQKRTELKLKKPDVPTRSLIQAKPDSQSNQYLLFTTTDLQKDAAQSTVPFIDTQSVEPRPPIPLSGAGIYHKGRDGYGGFIALKLMTYDFEPQLRADLPPNPPIIAFSNDVDAM